MRAMLWVGIAGATLLLIFTVWLAWRNWTPEIYKPVFSVLGGGIVALLITLMAILRPSEEQRNFVSSVVIDERTHLPANIKVNGFSFPDDNASLENRIAWRHFMIGSLADKETFTVCSSERTDALVAEFFQYKLLIDIHESWMGERQYAGYRDEQGIGRFSVSVQKRIPPPREDKVAGDKVLQWIKTNRLSKLPLEIDRWKTRGLSLPRGVQIQLDNQVVNSVPERSITIPVPGFLNAYIRVRCLGSPGVGILPPGVSVDPDDAKHYSTYTIEVMMRSRFEWLSAASSEMPAYKQWILFLFERLDHLNSDNSNMTKSDAKVLEIS